LNGEVLAAFIAIGFIGVVNLITAAFIFGRIKQKVDDLCKRVERLELIQNGKDRDARHKAENG